MTDSETKYYQTVWHYKSPTAIELVWDDAALEEIASRWNLDPYWRTPDKPQLPDTNAADMAQCVQKLRAHLKPKHLLIWWIFANMIGAGIYLAQLASLHFGGSQ